MNVKLQDSYGSSNKKYIIAPPIGRNKRNENEAEKFGKFQITRNKPFEKVSDLSNRGNVQSRASEETSHYTIYPKQACVLFHGIDDHHHDGIEKANFCADEELVTVR